MDSQRRGPLAILTVSCDGCAYLVRDRSDAVFGCDEPRIRSANDGHPQIVGIGNASTPPFCPFRGSALERVIESAITRREAGQLAVALTEHDHG